MYAWAVGSNALYLPEEAGFRIGINGIRYIILEVHYDNPLGTQGIVDSSGVEITMTKKLRPVYLIRTKLTIVRRRCLNTR